MSNLKVSDLIKYILVIVCVCFFAWATIYPYIYISRENSVNIQPFKFYYSGNTSNLFFKDKNNVTDYITTYEKFRSFIDKFNEMLEDENDVYYQQNKRAVQNLQNTYTREYFENGSIIAFAMHGETGRTIDSKLINVDIINKKAHIVREVEDSGEGEQGKIEYVMYFIPSEQKEILNTYIHDPTSKLTVLKYQLQALPLVVLICSCIKYIATKSRLKKQKQELETNMENDVYVPNSDQIFAQISNEQARCLKNFRIWVIVSCVGLVFSGLGFFI